jgi:hypothetical protein
MRTLAYNQSRMDTARVSGLPSISQVAPALLYQVEEQLRKQWDTSPASYPENRR